MTRARVGSSFARAALVTVASISLAFACAPIEGAPLSDAPLNAGCPEINPCDAYDVKNTKTPAQCRKDGRCDFGAPDFPFTMVVNVPSLSVYAPGRTFFMTSDSLLPQSTTTARGSCIAPTCLQLPALVPASGKYRVTKAAAEKVGLPLAEGSSLPVTVSFVPLRADTDVELDSQGIPFDRVFTSSRPQGRPATATYIDALSLGDFLRISYPQPPFDAFFPPSFTKLQVTDRFVPDGIFDDFLLGSADELRTDVIPLDDETGETRMATVSRLEGLDGWRVWLELAQRRISSIRTLSGTKSVVRLDTVGQSQLPPSRSLKEDVDIIVAPPEGWLGVPRLQSRLINGQGLELELPSLPTPVAIKGVVANGDEAAGTLASGGGALTGVPANLSFTSTGLRLLDGTLQPLLRYKTTVTTDETGHFSTVLPSGLYDVTIDPAEGTGFSKVKDTSFDTAKDHLVRVRTLRAVATGRVVLADGRPLSGAEVFAIPSEKLAVGAAVKPRPARTRTDRDGRFRFEADQGEYTLIVDPQAGTGFPRFVQLRSIPTETADLGVIQIAPPARLSFTLRSPPERGVVQPIARAVVRIFAELQGPPAVEIGRAMTDDAGKVEILLAQQAR